MMRIRGQRQTRISRSFLYSLVAAGTVVVVGLALAPHASAQASATNVQEGDNSGRTRQRGSGESGAAIAGQVAGVVSSGRASIDATNRTENASAQSGDVDGSNSVNSFVGNEVQGVPCPGSLAADTTVAQRGACPSSPSGQDIIFDGSLTAAIVHEGDNRQTIDQSARAVSGDAIVGQVIGAVTAGDTSIVASNDARDVDATSGDADANNSIGDAETSNLVTFAPCPCPLPTATDIIAANLNVVVLHEGDNTQRIGQSATASTGDALAGGQVIGAVTGAGGRQSIDATNRGRNSDATSGDADADNFIGVAASGNAGIDVPACCTEELPPPLPEDGFTADIVADDIFAAVVHEGDNRQRIGQTASASTGDALSSSQVIGSVSSGDSSIVASNDGENADATSGDADASNAIDDAQTSNLVIFGEPPCCPLPVDIVGDTLTAPIIHEGDNTQTLGQTASASTGDALSASQVIGAVTAAGASTSVDATNRGRNTSATSGDADASNSIPFAFVGNEVDGFISPGSFLPADITNASGAIIQEGDNRQTERQSALASSGDALSGAQVVGVVSGGAASVVVANDGENIDAQSGDADFDNTADTRTGLLVRLGLDFSSPTNIADAGPLLVVPLI